MTITYWNKHININPRYSQSWCQPDRNPTGTGLGCAECGQEVRMTGSVTQVSTDGAATWGRRDADMAYISIIQDTVPGNLDKTGQAVGSLTTHTHTWYIQH